MYSDVIKEIVETILDTIKRGIDQWGKFDKTFTAEVKKKVGGSKYLVTYMGNELTVFSTVSLTVGSIVRVCAPQNNWNDLFVVVKVS